MLLYCDETIAKLLCLNLSNLSFGIFSKINERKPVLYRQLSLFLPETKTNYSFNTKQKQMKN